MVKLNEIISCNFKTLDNKNLVNFEIIVLDILINQLDTKNNNKTVYFVFDEIHDQILEEMEKRGLIHGASTW